MLPPPNSPEPEEPPIETESDPLPLPNKPEDLPDLEELIEAALPVSRIEERLIPPVLFEHDSTRVVPCGEVSLYLALEIIQGREEALVVEGHADGAGTAEYNDSLSRERAEYVRSWFVEHGVKEERLQIAWQGERGSLSVGEGNDGADDEREPLRRRVILRWHRDPSEISE